MKIDKATYQQRMAAFHKACRENDLRFTPQRVAVFQALASSADHPSAETIHKRVRKQLPTITLDTVYRTLGTLEEAGLVLRVSVVRGGQRFEANTQHHNHFICRECGAILDVFSTKLNPLKLGNNLPPGYVVDWAQIELRGRCSRCASAQS